MSEPTPAGEPQDIPPLPLEPRSRWSAGLIWLVPAVAALIGLSMVIHSWSTEGPGIEISFLTAEGLEAGKTPVRFKDVTIGTVTSVRLARDLSKVRVQVKLNHDARSFATSGSRFWVVRPRFGATGISGIGTLLSGAYIAADTGAATAPRYTFVGLEEPPPVIHGAPGRRFLLLASDIGSLDVGSPVYFRRIQVGRVVSYQLDADGRQMLIGIFIDSPYDRFVDSDTRFWNASGLDLNLDASGLRLSTQSLATVIAGGIAFLTPPGPPAAPAPQNAQFTLFDDQASAMAPPDGAPEYLRMRFEQSLRGLIVGSPVDFRGITVGKVVSIDLDYDATHQRFPLIVGAVVYPQRFGRAYEKLSEAAGGGTQSERFARLLKSFVAGGLRAQARTGNMLTGQLFVALDFVPRASRVSFDERARPMELPTAPGSFDRLQEQLGELVDKINRIPFDAIGHDLDHTLLRLDATLQEVQGRTLPQLNNTLGGVQGTTAVAQRALAQDGPMMQNLERTLAELQRMARSLRVFSDALQRNPQSLLRGLPPDPVVTPAPQEKTP
ncbi:MAG: MCE family protein [Proteobacteria bacterium]|nr:MCE family protein [Pseudomonadota bacterium]